ncbi:MAG: hypothetical protein WCD63_11660 [Terrimicrobiaceae bacterium]
MFVTSITVSTRDERVIEPSARGYVNAARASDYNGVVTRPPQRFHGAATGNTSASDHGQAHRYPPDKDVSKERARISSIYLSALLTWNSKFAPLKRFGRVISAREYLADR